MRRVEGHATCRMKGNALCFWLCMIICMHASIHYHSVYMDSIFYVCVCFEGWDLLSTASPTWMLSHTCKVATKSLHPPPPPPGLVLITLFFQAHPLLGHTDSPPFCATQQRAATSVCVMLCMWHMVNHKELMIITTIFHPVLFFQAGQLCYKCGCGSSVHQWTTGRRNYQHGTLKHPLQAPLAAVQFI